PGFENVNGNRFDKFVPRVTFSGPLRRNRAWFFDGLEFEIDQTYVKELPEGQNTNHLQRGSNLLRTQWNATPHDIVNAGLLMNGYRSPYDGLSFITPRESTVKREIS